MAQGIYKNGEIIKLTYHAIGSLSAAAPTCKVFDEADASDLVRQSELHSALTAGEKAGGFYHGHFTPDAEGRWTVYIKDKNSEGVVTKNYNVSGYNIDAVGDAQVTMESGLKSDALLQQSAIVSSVKSDLVKVESGVKSAALVDRSAIVSSIKSDALLQQSSIISSVKSAVLVQTSDVKSAVLAVGSPASVS